MDIPDCKLGALGKKDESSAFAASGLHHARTVQLLKNLGEKTLRHFCPLGNITERSGGICFFEFKESDDRVFQCLGYFHRREKRASLSYGFFKRFVKRAFSLFVGEQNLPVFKYSAGKKSATKKNTMKRKSLISGLLLSFLCGVLCFDMFRTLPLFWSTLLLPCVFLFPKRWQLCAILCSIGFLCGMGHVLITLHAATPNKIDFYAGDDPDTARFAELEGIISSFPDIRSDQVKVYLEAERFRIGENELWQQTTGKVLVNLPLAPAVSYGDRIFVRGKLLIPPEWEDFSYQRYLEKEGTYAYIPRASFEVLDKKQGNPLFRMLFQARTAIEFTIRHRIPEPEASFAIGILLGGERGFSEQTIEEFRITGLSHLLALSGFNITILILFIFAVFRFLPKHINLILTLLSIAAFVLLTGASASVVRAAVMGLLSLFVLHFGSMGHPSYILLWSAFCIVLINPFLLFSDVSFQLSVAAVIGLIFFTPLWEKWFQKVPAALGLRDGLQTTMAAQITAVPLVAFYFQRVSLISPLANILVAPLIPVAMLCSFLTLLPGIGILFAFGAYQVLHLALFITTTLSKIPHADVGFQLGIMSLIFFYTLLATIVIFISKRNSE